MSHRGFFLPRLRLLVLFALCLAPAAAFAQDEETKDPVFREFKGVHIGMTTADCRAKLGAPTDKSDAQDFYASDKQTVQVYYDAGKVSAISVVFSNPDSTSPAPKSVFGSDIAAKPDGSMYKMVRYPKAGYWLSYSRTAGDSAMIIITMQKIR